MGQRPGSTEETDVDCGGPFCAPCTGIPVPSFSSTARNPAGPLVSNDFGHITFVPFTVTVSFSALVSNVQVSDFTIEASPGAIKDESAQIATYRYSTALHTGASITDLRPVDTSSSTGPANVWVLTVDVDDDQVPAAITIDLPAAAGSISPTNAAARQAATITYSPGTQDVCIAALGAGACGIGAVGLDCEIDGSDGLHNCLCMEGRYGANCGSVCPEGWTEHTLSGEHASCFKLAEQAGAWDTVRQACQLLGGDLAIVYNSSSLLSSITQLCDGAPCWLGGGDMGDEGTYLWVDGSPVDLEFEGWVRA